MQKIVSNNRYVVFLYRMIILYAMLFIARLCYVLFNINFFKPIEFAEITKLIKGGFLFDSASIAYLMGPFILLSLVGGFLPYKIEKSKAYRVITDLFYIIPSVINFAVNVGDAGYYPFILKRMTRDVFTEFASDDLFNLILHLAVSFWHFTIIIVFGSFLLCWLYYIVRFDRKEDRSTFKKIILKRAIDILAMCFVSIFFVSSLKGFSLDMYNVPMTPMRASLYCKRLEHRPIVLNTVFCMFRTMGKPILEDANYFTEERCKELFDPIYKAKPISENDSIYGSMRGRNIVFLIMESFACEFTGFYNKSIANYPSYTPFLDSLANEGYTFEYGYANGRISVQAMPSILCSLPSMGFRYVNSFYTNNKLISIADILRKDNYVSTFYHGGFNGTMGFDAFVNSVGFDNYFGKTEYNNDSDFDGLWGIFDEPFLNRVAKEIASSHSPHISTIFTLSSHTPYTLPDKYKQTFTSGTMPMHKVISYSDMAIRKFFDKMKESKDYENTLFVLVADHCSVTDREEYSCQPGRYRIPIIFYDPKGKLKNLDTSTIAQQADILPSLLYLLGNETPIISYGNNLFDKNAPHYAIERDGGVYYLIKRDFMLKYDPEKNETEVVAPALHVQADNSIVDKWENKPSFANSLDTLKAIIQTYNKRMINDKMTVE